MSIHYKLFKKKRKVSIKIPTKIKQFSMILAEINHVKLKNVIIITLSSSSVCNKMSNSIAVPTGAKWPDA